MAQEPEDKKGEVRVELGEVDAINNLDTARMALRWALERIRALEGAEDAQVKLPLPTPLQQAAAFRDIMGNIMPKTKEITATTSVVYFTSALKPDELAKHWMISSH